MSKRDNIIKWSIIGIFVTLYILVSCISTIHVIDFFKLSNPDWLAITLAIAFEVGAAACLGALIILSKTSKALVWILFILITGLQVMGNMYYSYSHIKDFQGWIELFGLNEEEPVFQKRILSIVSGAILPIVALGFIKSLVDYIRPENEDSSEKVEPEIKEEIKTENKIWEKVSKLREEGKLTTPSQEDIDNEPTDLAFTSYDIEDKIQAEEEKEIEQKSHTDIEVKLAKAISKNPDLKEKLNEEIKKLEAEDKYSNLEDSDVANVNTENRTFGGM